MIGAFVKGIDQLGDKATRKYLWFSIIAALITFAALWSVIGWVLTETAISSVGWLEGIIDVLGGLATLVLTWFLFPATVSGVIGLFLDQVAECVENRHYPHLGPANGQSVGEAVIMSAKFLGILVVLNILMLPFLFLGPLFPFVFYLVNGYLLGREYFELVASRRLPQADVAVLRKSRQGSVLMVGIVIAFALTIPVVNLLMPVVATSAMVHLFEKWRPDGVGRAAAKV
ncbi:MAG: EI24 domain-containing protein [Rhodospirillales bacterium]